MCLELGVYTEATEGSSVVVGDGHHRGFTFSVYCWIPLKYFSYVSQRKMLVDSEDYHHQHSCEQSSQMTGREYREARWRV